MPPSDISTSVTSLFGNDVLTRIERLRLNASRRFTNRSRGEHLAGRFGQSMEFRDFRDYAAGDDIRFLDWNALARLQRPYIKLFHQEEEMHVVILLDTSESMAFEGKFERARQLAGAMAVMGLLAPERVSVRAVGQADVVRTQGPFHGRASMRPVFNFLESIEPGGDVTINVGIEQVLKNHHGRGVVVVISDFLTTDDLRGPFNHLFSRGLEIFAVQLLGPTEIDPDVNGDIRLMDAETAGNLDVSGAQHLLDLYQQYRTDHQRLVDELCRRRGGRFVSFSSDLPLEQMLFDQLRRRGWVR